jgi:hypothetical protein
MAEKSVCSAPATRSTTDFWLIGQTQSELPKNVLPTTGDILRTFFHHHRICKKTIPESSKHTAESLTEIWNRARIPTTYETHIVAKIKGLVESYSLVKKNKGRDSESQKTREKQLIDQLNTLFDITHNDAESRIKIEEDRVFLQDQRSHRRMFMSGVDKILSEKEDRAEQRKKAEGERRKREKMRQ